MVLKELEMLGSHFRIETKEKETKKGPLQKGGRVLQLIKHSQIRKNINGQTAGISFRATIIAYDS